MQLQWSNNAIRIIIIKCVYAIQLRSNNNIIIWRPSTRAQPFPRVTVRMVRCTLDVCRRAAAVTAAEHTKDAFLCLTISGTRTGRIGYFSPSSSSSSGDVNDNFILPNAGSIIHNNMNASYTKNT